MNTPLRLIALACLFIASLAFAEEPPPLGRTEAKQILEHMDWRDINILAVRQGVDDKGAVAPIYAMIVGFASRKTKDQTLCQTLQGVREAMETMRDHASEVYRVETGKPFSSARGSTVSKGFTASQISARDYLAARSRERREQFAPEGPLVAVSGGQEWHDHEILWDRLDGIKARVPEMVLITTAQRKGVDAVATAWAASRSVKTVQFVPDRSLGNRAAFVRNDKMVNLKPVEAIVCEGSGIQANLAQKLRQAGVPLHIMRLTDQCAVGRLANRG